MSRILVPHFHVSQFQSPLISYHQMLFSPILKLSNYRLISNLSVVSKIIERIVKSRRTNHLTVNRLFNPVQSAYRKFHSTETILLTFAYFLPITASASTTEVVGSCHTISKNRPKCSVALCVTTATHRLIKVTL